MTEVIPIFSVIHAGIWMSLWSYVSFIFPWFVLFQQIRIIVQKQNASKMNLSIRNNLSIITLFSLFALSIYLLYENRVRCSYTDSCCFADSHRNCSQSIFSCVGHSPRTAIFVVCRQSIHVYSRANSCIKSYNISTAWIFTG